MMLPRKRARPNPAEANQNNLPTASTVAQPTSLSQASTSAASARTSSDPQMPPVRRATNTSGTLTEQEKPHGVRKARSWYGAWPTPPKAAASTSVAKEHILGGTVKTTKAPDLSRFDHKKGDDTASIYSTTGTARGLPKIPEMNMDKTTTKEDSQETEAQKPDSDTPPPENLGLRSDEVKEDIESPTTAATPPRPAGSGGWFGWLSKNPTTETKPAVAPERPEMMEVTSSLPKGGTVDTEDARPATPAAQTEPPQAASQDVTSPESASQQAATDQVSSSKASKSAPTTSWFGFWNSSENQATKSGQSSDAQPVQAPTQTPKSTSEQASNSTPASAPEATPESASKDVTMTDAPPTPQKSEPTAQTSSTWAFWSRDSPKVKGKAVSPESGEIAVMGEGSEDHPKPAEETEVSSSPSKEPKEASKPKDIQAGGKSTWRRNKRLRPKSADLDSISSSPSSINVPNTAGHPVDMSQSPPMSAVPARILVDASSRSIAESEVATKLSNNLLLPSFTSTYRMKENPSILKQITRLLLRTQQAPATHVLRLKDPPKIRKAIAIGIHGLFPASYLRPMIGQPTGTSLRFATLCADAIRRWAEDHGCGDCEIEKVALEGEGKIKDRVDNLWKLMLNWIDQIRSADLVIIACHSQGVPVSIMLLEKLIDLGIITNAKIGVCAMAGVSLGPFPDIKSSLLMGSAAELWDFANPESANSKRFEASLKHVLDHGARITFIGSIDDQLVPMESAIYSPANHPNIYRAVFIDGHVHAPNFIAHLVGFALKLRNLGISDHGLIRELSAPLAGSLYSGAGHSRLYYDDAVYDLAISHTLETTHTRSPPPCQIEPRQASAAASNPYVLPWIMRGLLEEDFVKTDLSAEANELLRQFDDWKPTNKALKDVKYRLEAVRSRL